MMGDDDDDDYHDISLVFDDEAQLLHDVPIEWRVRDYHRSFTLHGRRQWQHVLSCANCSGGLPASSITDQYAFDPNIVVVIRVPGGGEKGEGSTDSFVWAIRFDFRARQMMHPRLRHMDNGSVLGCDFLWILTFEEATCLRHVFRHKEAFAQSSIVEEFAATARDSFASLRSAMRSWCPERVYSFEKGPNGARMDTTFASLMSRHPACHTFRFSCMLQTIAAMPCEAFATSDFARRGRRRQRALSLQALPLDIQDMVISRCARELVSARTESSRGWIALRAVNRQFCASVDASLAASLREMRSRAPAVQSFPCLESRELHDVAILRQKLWDARIDVFAFLAHENHRANHREIVPKSVSVREEAHVMMRLLGNKLPWARAPKARPRDARGQVLVDMRWVPAAMRSAIADGERPRHPPRTRAAVALARRSQRAIAFRMHAPQHMVPYMQKKGLRCVFRDDARDATIRHLDHDSW
jgi:hypothetical protein